MKTVIPGTHILIELKLRDTKTGAWRSIAGYSWTTETQAGIGVTPAVPTVTELDEFTSLLRIDTTGLNGRSCRTRALVLDPLSGDPVATDVDYLVKP